MPMLILRTNRIVSDDQRTALLQAASQTVAEMLGKPERYVMVSLEDARPLVFGGTDQPAAYLELKSIGLQDKHTKDYSARLSELLEDKLDIPRERIYVEFADAARQRWGWNGGTF